MSRSTIFPVSSKDSYSQNDIVDFLMTFDERMVVSNSIRITGKVKVAASGNIANATALNTSQDINIDAETGIHSAFQSITCSCDNLGIIEQANEYPRYVKAKTSATMSSQQVLTDCANITELRCADNIHTKHVLRGNSEPDNLNKIPFSFKPDIAFNKTSDHIPFSKVGACKITLRLATDNMFLFGADVATANITYRLYDLRLEYLTSSM